MENILFKRIKEKTIELKVNTVNFCKEHKGEIITGTVITILGTGCTYLGINNSNLRKTVVNLASENKNLKSELKDAKNYIKDLVDQSNRKDAGMKTTMSDGLRHGSSIAAQQMAYKRWLN